MCDRCGRGLRGATFVCKSCVRARICAYCNRHGVQVCGPCSETQGWWANEVTSEKEMRDALDEWEKECKTDKIVWPFDQSIEKY